MKHIKYVFLIMFVFFIIGCGHDNNNVKPQPKPKPPKDYSKLVGPFKITGIYNEDIRVVWSIMMKALATEYPVSFSDHKNYIAGTQVIDVTDDHFETYIMKPEGVKQLKYTIVVQLTKMAKKQTSVKVIVTYMGLMKINNEDIWVKQKTNGRIEHELLIEIHDLLEKRKHVIDAFIQKLNLANKRRYANEHKTFEELINKKTSGK